MWGRIRYDFGCWVWTGAMRPDGYATFRNKLAHRLVYTEEVGNISDGMDLDHLCRNRRCVNPLHLEPVTRAENLRRGAGSTATRERHARVTICPKGHPKLGDNLSLRPDGRRRCKLCAMLAARAKRKLRGHGPDLG